MERGRRSGRQTGEVAVIDAFGARWTLDVSGLDDHLADELLHLWDRALVEPAHESQRAHPEDSAHDGGVVEERLSLG